MNDDKKTDETTEKRTKNQRIKVEELQFGDVIASVHIKADRPMTTTDRKRAVHALRELADDLEAGAPTDTASIE
jgi:hypothetical protein